ALDRDEWSGLRLHLRGARAREPRLEVEQVLRRRHADLVTLLLVAEVLLGQLARDARRVDPLARRDDVGDGLARLERHLRKELAMIQLGLAERDLRLRVLAPRERVRERNLELETEGVGAEVVAQAIERVVRVAAERVRGRRRVDDAEERSLRVGDATRRRGLSRLGDVGGAREDGLLHERARRAAQPGDAV